MPPSHSRRLAISLLTLSASAPRADGKRPPWSHGYHTLPDKTLTPLHGHQGLIVAHDGTIYALILYPFTLLQIKGVN